MQNFSQNQDIDVLEREREKKELFFFWVWKNQEQSYQKREEQRSIFIYTCGIVEWAILDCFVLGFKEERERETAAKESMLWCNIDLIPLNQFELNWIEIKQESILKWRWRMGKWDPQFQTAQRLWLLGGSQRSISFFYRKRQPLFLTTRLVVDDLLLLVCLVLAWRGSQWG